MGKKLRQFGLRSKALLFTVVIHGALIAFLFYFNRSDTVKRGGDKSTEAVAVSARDLWSGTVKSGGAKPIQVVVSARDFEAEQEKKKQEVEEKKKKIEAEKKRKAEQLKKLEAEKKRKDEQLKKKQEDEKKRKADELKKKQEDEKKRKADELKKKQEVEKKRKAEQLKKKQEAEKKRKAEELKKKQEAETKRQRAEQLRKRLEQEQRAKNENDADHALHALVDRIASVVENNWRRPQTSQSGLTATIGVKVARDGQVLSAWVIHTSGDPGFDDSAQIAVRKASPLPFPSEPHYYEFINEFNFKFDPDAPDR